MEKKLISCLEEIHEIDNGVTGCLVADKYGLCLAATGKADPEKTGIITAFARQAAKLEPNGGSTGILLENDNRKCLIKACGNITGAVFKSNLQS